MMTLGLIAGPLGAHLAGWRHPDSFPTTSMQLQNAIEVAQLAERGKFDLIFLADGNGRPPDGTSRSCSPPTALPTARPGSSPSRC